MNWAFNGFESGWEGFKYLGVGALAGALGAGVGAGVNTALAGGSFSAGFIGSSTVTSISTGFASGFVTGAAGGGTSGFLTGFGNKAMESGSKFGDMLIAGFNNGCLGVLTGGVMGGITGGIDAVKNNRNFWTGSSKQRVIVKINPNGSESLISEHNYTNPNTSELVNKYYATSLNENSSAITNSNGKTIIKVPKNNITKITGIKAISNKSGLIGVENLKIGRKIITFNTPFGKPDYFVFYGWRYHSTPVRSLEHLFHSRSGSINLFNIFKL